LFYLKKINFCLALKQLFILILFVSLFLLTIIIAKNKDTTVKIKRIKIIVALESKIRAIFLIFNPQILGLTATRVWIH
jgi:hypothetical protein